MKPGLVLSLSELAAGQLNGVVKGSFAKHYLGECTPDLNFADVLNIRRQRYAPVNFVAFDTELLQQVGIALGVHDLPMRVRRSRHLEVVRKSEDVFPVHDHVGNSASIGFWADELTARMHVRMHILSESAGRSQQR